MGKGEEEVITAMLIFLSFFLLIIGTDLLVA